jgi:hypothetical protein
MRATRLACLVALYLLVHATMLMAGPRDRDRGRKHPADGRGPAAELFTWEADGFGISEDEARRDALKKGSEALLAYLSEEGFSLEWQPSTKFLEGLVKDWTPVTVKDPKGKEKKVLVEVGLDNVQGQRARFVLNVEKYQELVAQEQTYRAEQRMGIVGKGLAGLVALLAAVAGYFRLEEATKGYYTAWLRVGAVGFLAAAGAGLWLLS